MATRSKKSSTPSQTSARPASPLSPTRHSRLQEKADLQNLNDRLACYIDRVRYLEAENNRLTREVQTTQETVTREVSNIKSMYDHELSDARRLLDETHKEKARLEIDTKRLWDENEELKAALAKKSKDLLLADNNVRVLETRANDLTLKYNQALADAKKATAEARDLEKERDKFKKQVDELRKQLEEESLARVDVENNNQSLREELSFKDQVYQQQLSETRTRRQVEISEIDGRLAEQYEVKMQQALQELRDQYESQMANNRGEIEMLYENKIKNLQTAANRNSGAATAAIDELRQIRTRIDTLSSKITELEGQNGFLTNRCRELEKLLGTRIDTLSSKITELEGQNGFLTNRCRELEKLLENERLRHAEDLDLLEKELARMRDEMAHQLQEYQDLMDIKVSLDLEIATYRKMLESEEARLNITPPGSAETSRTVRGSSQRRTPVRAGAKRKRTLLEESQEKPPELLEEAPNGGLHVTSSSKGDIEVSEADADGKFVKIHNKSNKEVSLSGWQILRKAGEEETLYKFHRSIKIDPNATIAVWSSDLGKEHEPPSNLVMKGQRWFVSDNMTTTILNSEGAEVAQSERIRRHLSSSTSRHRETSGG
ncbi:Lamin Tail Domain [Popillia japonica]